MKKKHIIQVRFSNKEEEQIKKRVKGNFKNRSEYHKKCFQKFISTDADNVFKLDLVDAKRMSYNQDVILENRFNVSFATEEELIRVKSIAEKCSLQASTLLRYLTLLDLKENQDVIVYEEEILNTIKKLKKNDKKKVLELAQELLKSY